MEPRELLFAILTICLLLIICAYAIGFAAGSGAGDGGDGLGPRGAMGGP